MKKEDFEIAMKVYKSGRCTYIIRRRYLFGLIKRVETSDDRWWYGGSKRSHEFTSVERAKVYIEHTIENYLEHKVEAIRTLSL